MSGRPSRVRQREIQQIVRGAMKAGAKGISFHIGEVKVDVKLDAPDSAPSIDEWGINDTHQT
jgi:hypothetical protein